MKLLSLVSLRQLRRPRLESLHSQQRDLFGDQTQHENNDRCREHENRHIGKAMLRDIGVDVVSQTAQKTNNAHGQENAKRSEQRCDFGDDEQKAKAVGHQADFALSTSIERLYWHIFNRKPRP